MLKSKIKNSILNLYKKRVETTTYKKEILNIKKKTFIWQEINFSDEQEKEIQEYYISNYGKTISTKWHRLYQSYLNKYDKKYFPEILFSTYLEKKLNDFSICKILEDKALLELLFDDVKDLKFPKTYVINCSNICYDEKRNIITQDDLLNMLKNVGKVLIKKTLDSSSGRSIKICDFRNSIDTFTNKSVTEILKQYKENYIVQSIEKNCEEIATLYPHSLNTFRIMTYIVNGKLYHIPLTLRLGRNKSIVDNLHAGGIMVGVKDNGDLQKLAFTEYHEMFEKHPDTKVKFENYNIPYVNKIIELAYECHKRLPHVGIASWDFAINENNEIVLIEVNLRGQSIWFPQMANGCAAFGENTEYMLNLIK